MVCRRGGAGRKARSVCIWLATDTGGDVYGGFFPTPTTTTTTGGVAPKHCVQRNVRQMRCTACLCGLQVRASRFGVRPRMRVCISSEWRLVKRYRDSCGYRYGTEKIMPYGLHGIQLYRLDDWENICLPVDVFRIMGRCCQGFAENTIINSTRVTRHNHHPWPVQY